MTIRHGTDVNLEAVRRLWGALAVRGPAPPPWADLELGGEPGEFDRALAANGLFLAEADGEVVGFVSAWLLENGVAQIGDIYVADSGRRHGAGRALVEAVTENLRARGAHARLSAEREPRRAPRSTRSSVFASGRATSSFRSRYAPPSGGRSFGAIHVQTDDLGAIERAVRQFVPRLPGGSNGSIVAPPRHGWTAVYDDVCDRDPSMLRRGSSRSERARLFFALGVEHEAGRPLRPVRSEAVSSTSTSPSPSTTARYRPAT